MKITKKETTLVEAYALALATTGYGIYSAGNHDIKKVAWAAAIAVFAPVWIQIKAKVKAKVATNAIPVELPAK